ncbi:MAG: molybdopterin-guanine dinucleotide biosynthesis protein [Salinibacterium sp.]|nr:molybdopterin-guanine dinucleotide biosynthesis protein [Salinibacterium sp.]
MNDDDRTLLESWAVRLLTALDINDLELDIDGVLDLAGAAAKSVVRPAAPVTTFLVGYAAGRAAAAGTDPIRAVTEATTAAETLAASN